MFLVHFLLLAKWFLFFFFSLICPVFSISRLLSVVILFAASSNRCALFCSALDILIDLLPIVCPYSMKVVESEGSLEEWIS